MAIGLLFNGQGSQRPGMGRDFYDSFPYVQAMYEEASQVLGYDLRKLIDEEPENLRILFIRNRHFSRISRSQKF